MLKVHFFERNPLTEREGGDIMENNYRYIFCVSFQSWNSIKDKTSGVFCDIICAREKAYPPKNLAAKAAMHKRKLNQVTIFEAPAMFGGISLNPENDWVKLAKMIPWWAFEEKYAAQFSSKPKSARGQFPDCSEVWSVSEGIQLLPGAGTGGYDFPRAWKCPELHIPPHPPARI